MSFLIVVRLFLMTYAMAGPPLCVTDICSIADSASISLQKHGVDISIENNTGKSIMIPTKTCGELKSFLDNTPAGVSHDYNTDPCLCVTMGQAAPGGGICAGTFRNVKYMITPGGCTDSANPTCTGADSIIKYWVGTTGAHVDVPGVENIIETGAATASTQLGTVTTPLIAAHASVSADSAADYCNDMVYAGYSDWYLPSKSELVYLFCNSNRSGSRTAGTPEEQPNCAGDFNGPTTLLTNFASGYYNSSTEVNYAGDLGDAAWYQNFFVGYTEPNGKGTAARVRCMRAR